uniref:Myb/SANT-like DNA-binding domain-containing protein n=1 Tax=Oryzias latipes TaxID=8090 RepID=A0A3B3H9E2_ORYLA
MRYGGRRLHTVEHCRGFMSQVFGAKRQCRQNYMVVIEKDISRDMGTHGFKRSWLQCQRKIKSLKIQYNAVKDHNNKNGKFPFFEQMEGILGDRPSYRPPELLDSFRDDVASSVDCEEPKCENSNVTGKGKLKWCFFFVFFF